MNYLIDPLSYYNGFISASRNIYLTSTVAFGLFTYSNTFKVKSSINLVKLGMMDEAKKLSDSLNGYLNIYKTHMMTALRALDFFNNIKLGRNCNEQGCNIDDQKN